MSLIAQAVEGPGKRLADAAGEPEGPAGAAWLCSPEALPGRTDPQQRLQPPAGRPEGPQGGASLLSARVKWLHAQCSVH